MIIGNFRYDAEHDIYSGEIRTLTFARANVFVRPHDKSGDKEPDYRILQELDAGSVELGAAWRRRGEGGREFLSVALDDPSLPAPVNAVMFIVNDGEGTRLVWQRQPRKTPVPEPKPAPRRQRRAQAAASPQPA